MTNKSDLFGPQNHSAQTEFTGILKSVKNSYWKVDFELWVGGRGQDMYQQLEGGFGSINQNGILDMAIFVVFWRLKW